MSSFAALRSAIESFALDESANALVEYSLVLAFLSIGSIVAFTALSTAATSAVSTDTSNFSNSAENPP